MPFIPDTPKKGSSFTPDNTNSFTPDSGSVETAAESHPIQAAIEGFGKTATLGYLPQMQAGIAKLLFPEKSYTQHRDDMIARSKDLTQSNPGSMLAGELTGGLTQLGVGAGLKGAKAIGAMAGQAALYNPGEDSGIVHNPLKGDIQATDRAKNALIGGVLGGVATGISTPLEWAGKRIMRLATGVEGARNLSPDMKNKIAGELLDSNLVGTKDMLQNQVNTKLQGAEVQLLKALRGQNVAPNVTQLTKLRESLKIPTEGQSDLVRTADTAKLQEVSDKLRDVLRMGALPGEGALKAARLAEKQQYTAAGLPVKGFSGAVNRGEAAAYKDAIKANIPGAKGLLFKEQSLIEADKALKKTHPSIDLPLVSSLAKYIPTTMIESAAAQAASKTGKSTVPLTRLLQTLSLENTKKE